MAHQTPDRLEHEIHTHTLIKVREKWQRCRKSTEKLDLLEFIYKVLNETKTRLIQGYWVLNNEGFQICVHCKVKKV